MTKSRIRVFRQKNPKDGFGKTHPFVIEYSSGSLRLSEEEATDLAEDLRNVLRWGVTHIGPLPCGE